MYQMNVGEFIDLEKVEQWVSYLRRRIIARQMFFDLKQANFFVTSKEWREWEFDLHEILKPCKEFGGVMGLGDRFKEICKEVKKEVQERGEFGDLRLNEIMFGVVVAVGGEKVLDDYEKN